MSRGVMTHATAAMILSTCALQPCFAFFDELRLEVACRSRGASVLKWPCSLVTVFLAVPIAAIAGGNAIPCVHGVAQMRVQLCFQATLDDLPGQLFEQPVF